MDRYEFNLKVEQLNKLVKSGDYKAAMRITDTIDWSRVHNAGLLTTVSEVYEKNEEYKEAREILLLAYDRAPVGKRALYRLAMLAIKERDIIEAQAYYNEYIEISPQDSRKYLMEYYIAEANGKDINKKIKILEKYNDIEKMDEQWKYQLALLYAKAGRIEDCIKTCDEIMLLFAVGEYVEKAATLKESTGCPLSLKQQELVDNKEYYEDRLNTIAKKYESGDRENYPNLNLDDMSAYKPMEDKKTTINLSDEEEIINENAQINTELFPKTVGINEIRISETTFKGESVNPEFEVELKRAIAITNENLNRMKGESDQSSMAEIDEEVRAHMEKVERIKHGRFITPPIMTERRKSRISNHFDSMGLPKTHGSRDEYRELVGNTRTWISEEQEDKFLQDEIVPDEDKFVGDEPVFEENRPKELPLEDTCIKEDEINEENMEDVSERYENSSEDISDVGKKDDLEVDKIDLININKNIAQNTEDTEPENEETVIEEDTKPTENVTVMETASTKVLENYVPEKKIPIFDNDDLINSYYDEEIDTGVPTVSSVMAKRKEQRDIVQSSVKSETKMEVVDDEEIYYTKEERTFVTKVKKGEEPEEIILEPEFKELEFVEEKSGAPVSVATQQTPIQEDNDVRKLSGNNTEDNSQSVKEDEEDSKESDTIIIEENEDNEIREADLPVSGEVMKARTSKSKEPKEYFMRRPGSIMVEGVTEQNALENAKEVLREVNELTKIKRSVLKIGALSLNNRGVMNSIDKIKGKDLIIVEAGKLDDNTILELIDFIRNGKETVVFADTISGISSLIEANDLLHGMSLVMREEEAPVKRKNVVANIVLKEKDYEKELKKVEEKREIDSQEEKQEDTSAKDLEAMDVIANLYGLKDGNISLNIQGIGSSDSIKFYNGEPKKEVVEEEAAKYMVDMAERKKAKEEEPKEEKQIIKLDPVISKTKEEKPVKPENQIEEDEGEPELKPFDSEYEDDDNVQMGVDKFIAYALKYVEEIECVLSYKTEYAIEERADYMKEDGTPLTKKNARNMIDHAADVAERPGIVKAIMTGLTNSKYDKEGRLILREEHFKI